MAHPTVDTAVRARLAANFNACEIRPEGSLEAGDGAPFLVVQFPYSSSRQASIGDPGGNRWREEGGVRFVLSVPRNRAAIAAGRQWAEEIATVFRGKRFDGVLTFAPTSPVSDDNNDVGGLYRLSWAVPYQFDVRG
ncbi:hypothetical protein [Jiella sonneratiae]|uniref:Tail terminator n=1 Tax=Jiella sonneratiae TaxID=2816856 RepID=A0ABS3J3H5_9HYPH|nr:hypothetical protein [Jiella sonneratiae]MBO0904215.1 hypothetical protein [Jiella sonneratiae]